MKDKDQINDKINNTHIFDKYDEYSMGYIEALQWVLEEESCENRNLGDSDV